MSLFKKKPKKPSEKISVHFVFIEESLEKVAYELMKWEESMWWPKKSAIRIARQTPGSTQMGTVFGYKLKYLPRWTAEVTQFAPHRLMVNTFKSRMLQGTETILIEERANGTKVEYRISYQVKGLLFKILWILIGDKAYSNGIKKILASFKDYMLQKSKEDQERSFEGKP